MLKAFELNRSTSNRPLALPGP